MSWIKDIISSNDSTAKDIRSRRGEKFPRDTYGPGYPIILHEKEIKDIRELLEKEADAPDGWENSPIITRNDFEEILEDYTGQSLPSPEARRDEIRSIIGLWEEQLDSQHDTVWTTIGTGTRFKLYITRCETRAEADDDDFREPSELQTARNILNRIEAVQDNDSKLAIVHRRDLPLEKASEDSNKSK